MSKSRGFPALHGTRVIPSGFLPSDLERPGGSSLEGTPVAERVRWTMPHARNTFLCYTCSSAYVSLVGRHQRHRINDASAKAQTNCNVEGSVVHPEEMGMLWSACLLQQGVLPALSCPQPHPADLEMLGVLMLSQHFSLTAPAPVGGLSP